MNAGEEVPWLDRAALVFPSPLRRATGALIDWAISLVVAAGAVSAASRLDVEGEGPELVAGSVALGVVHLFIYPALVGLTGRTPGKAAMGLHVITADLGEAPPGRAAAFRRTLVLWPGAIPNVGPFIAIAVLVVSLGLVVVDPQRRTLTDRVGRTLVVVAP